MSPSTVVELQAAVLQAALTLGLALLCAGLWAQYRKEYFLWWAIAWLLYVLRIAAIAGFLTTTQQIWLYAHQVLTGCTALALLWSAIVFSQQRRWRWRYVALAAFPVVWSYVAIYRLNNFLLAAGPAVLFLSLATLWTGWVFLQFRRSVGSRAAGAMAAVLFLWGLHHLDYPLLRARGAWSPWGYYLDIVLTLALGAGMLMLVLEDLERGVRTLSVLSGDLQPGARGDDVIDSLLARPLALSGVRGSALYLGAGSDGSFVQAVGACESWAHTRPTDGVRAAIERSVRSGRPDIDHGELDDAAPAYTAVLPIMREERVAGALVIVGSERDPFTALGDSFLLALGRQVGAALENADLYERLESRSEDLKRLARRMVRQHEEERRRISLELHDETAQVFSTVKMQLGLVRESAGPGVAPQLDRVLALVDTGIRSIRSVTSDLRPPLLDDLGLLAALRALVSDFSERCAIRATLDAPATLPTLGPDAELALFRAMQEALSNVARHAEAENVRATVGVEMTGDDRVLTLMVEDDGRGLGADARTVFDRAGHRGLAGMRERMLAIGGSLELTSPDAGGTRVLARLPLAEPEAT